MLKKFIQILVLSFLISNLFTIVYAQDSPIVQFKLVKSGKDLSNIVLEDKNLLTKDDIESVSVIRETYTENEIEFLRYKYPDIENRSKISIRIVFTEDGQKEFNKITKNNLKKKLGIIIDQELVSAPIIHEPIDNNISLITVYYTEEEVKSLIDKLNK